MIIFSLCHNLPLFNLYYKNGQPISGIDIEVKPVFPGGDAALMKFVAENCKYPEYARSRGIQGRVFVMFIINSEGKVTNPVIAKGVEAHLDAEAVRVVGLIPDWTPGMCNGKNVDVSFVVPINYKLYGPHSPKKRSRSDPASCGGILGLWRQKRQEKKAKKENKEEE